MGKKGKGNYRDEEEEQPNKKKTMITLEQLMDKSHMDTTQFIPILDTDSISRHFKQNDLVQAALRKIASDLNYVLYVDFKKFWATVLYNISFRHCLSSCLSHLDRKWLNNYKYSRQSQTHFNQQEQNLQVFKRVKDSHIFEYVEGINQVVLMIYYRIVNFNTENKELSHLYKLQDEITRKYILDFPKIFELIEIYGETNSALVKHIVKMYSKIVPDFYNMLTNIILPCILKKTEESLRRIKTTTQRQEFGISYSYSRQKDEEKSQGEQQLQRKIKNIMGLVNFTNIINSIIMYFPEESVDHCFFNSKIQLYYENIFFELESAYKIWNYQKQEINILNKINFLLKESIEYMLKFFDRANDIIVLRSRKSTTKEAYINSLQRIFKEFGKRLCITKKNQQKNMLLYNIIQKKFNLIKMAQMIYSEQVQDGNENFNLEYLKDFIITLESQNKDAYINQAEEQRQEEIQEQTQDPQEQKHEDFQQQPEIVKTHHQKPQLEQEDNKINENDQYGQPQTDDLQMLVPKRLRSQDYYANLYKGFNNKNFYKGQYEDDYDDLVDFDKRPLFQNEQSSDDESQQQQQKRLVSNMTHLNHVKELHNNKPQTSNKQTKTNPKYSRLEQNYESSNQQSKKYERRQPEPKAQKSYDRDTDYDRNRQQKTQKPKPKYMAKDRPEQMKMQKKNDINYNEFYPDETGRLNQKPGMMEGQQQQQSGGRGYKKSNKSYNYKPKDREPNNDKGRNSNKTKDYQNSNGNAGKRQYRPK